MTIIGAEDADDPIQQALISQIGLCQKTTWKHVDSGHSTPFEQPLRSRRDAFIFLLGAIATVCRSGFRLAGKIGKT